MSHALHLTETEIMAGLQEVRRSPQDHGSLNAIVIRPASDDRISLEQCRLSPEGVTESESGQILSYRPLPVRRQTLRPVLADNCG